MNKEDLIKVTSRSVGSVGYTIPELNITRVFQPRETKELTFGEIEALSWVPGGIEILADHLLIRNEEALKSILPDVEPEYFYTEDEIKELLLTGSLDSFLDCLDFAPEGVLNIVKNLAVSLELNDIQKRNAILDKLDFDVTKAIEIKNTKFDDGSEEEDDAPKVRRASATPIQNTSVPKRRVTIPVQ